MVILLFFLLPYGHITIYRYYLYYIGSAYQSLRTEQKNFRRTFLYYSLTNKNGINTFNTVFFRVTSYLNKYVQIRKWYLFIREYIIWAKNKILYFFRKQIDWHVTVTCHYHKCFKILNSKYPAKIQKNVGNNTGTFSELIFLVLQ